MYTLTPHWYLRINQSVKNAAFTLTPLATPKTITYHTFHSDQHVEAMPLIAPPG